MFWMVGSARSKYLIKKEGIPIALAEKAKARENFRSRMTWKDNKLYSIEEDEEGYQVVKRYKITWNY